VLLGICGGAVRRYLQERDALPRRSLTALVPVSLRDDATVSLAGNVLTFVPMSLATDVAEHTERIATIRDSARDAKARLAVLGEDGAAQYGVLVNAVAAVTQIFGLPFYLATPANLVVTNLIGPSGPRYLAGGRLHGIYAHAPMTNGVGLNVAMVSYAGSACIGLTADPGIVDDLDGLASCLHDVADSLVAPDHHSTPSSTQALIR
jgi:diacylglycerol O-acyltransferase